MREIVIIKLTVAALVLCTLIYFLSQYRHGQDKLPFRQRWRTMFSGFLANFFDTFGIGSFSSLFAFRNAFGLMPDDKRYNGTIIIQATLTTLVQSILFLQMVRIDLLTLVVAALSIAVGGICSGYLVRFVSRRFIYNVMLLTFILTVVELTH